MTNHRSPVFKMFIAASVCSGALVSSSVFSSRLIALAEEPIGVNLRIITPAAVWNPSPAMLQSLEKKCGNAGAQQSECTESFMSLSGASPQALGFAKRLSDAVKGTAYLEEFHKTGIPDVVVASLPFQANTNEIPFVVNGYPPLIDVMAECGKLDIASHSPAFVKKFPNAGFEGGAPIFSKVQQLNGGGKRLIFEADVTNGCHACGVGNATIAFDFDSTGKFLGARLLQLNEQKGN
jgi:hypothetical protein